MSAAPMNSTISSGLTKRSWKITCDSTPISFAKSCKMARYLSPLAAQNVRMSRACDDVDNILVLGQNLRQGLNYVFDSLIRREQSEREQHRFSFDAKAVLVEIRIQEGQVRNPVRHHVDLAARYLEDLLQKLGGKLAHDNETV